MNGFLTGSAGAGKTYTLNQYIQYLKARKVPVAITASTGIAATHMNPAEPVKKTFSPALSSLSAVSCFIISYVHLQQPIACLAHSFNFFGKIVKLWAVEDVHMRL
jgi:GTPase SAR1 family protein